ncbi:MAG TPA: twin-arginine translocation signal domain-containing protein [Pyrinomonadaceae bacterium]|nr:twin-arginine translocation signal domain-containing protein [Pyrinomonadaceae bacterium]
MSEPEADADQIITRRDFLRGSAALLACAPALGHSAAHRRPNVPTEADYSSVEACAVGHSGKRAVPIVSGVVHPLVAAGGLFTAAGGEAVIFKDGQVSVGNKLYFRRN